MVFNLVLTNNTIFSGFFLFFLIIGLYFSGAAVIEQIFNPNVACAMPMEIPSKQAKSHMETYLVTAGSKISKCLM